VAARSVAIASSSDACALAAGQAARCEQGIDLDVEQAMPQSAGACRAGAGWAEHCHAFEAVVGDTQIADLARVAVVAVVRGHHRLRTEGRPHLRHRARDSAEVGRGHRQSASVIVNSTDASTRPGGAAGHAGGAVRA
jgi:hypothetical protein